MRPDILPCLVRPDEAQFVVDRDAGAIGRKVLRAHPSVLSRHRSLCLPQRPRGATCGCTMHRRLSGGDYAFNASCDGAPPLSHCGLFSLRIVEILTVTGETHIALFGA